MPTQVLSSCFHSGLASGSGSGTGHLPTLCYCDMSSCVSACAVSFVAPSLFQNSHFQNSDSPTTSTSIYPLLRRHIPAPLDPVYVKHKTDSLMRGVCGRPMICAFLSLLSCCDPHGGSTKIHTLLTVIPVYGRIPPRELLRTFY